MNKSILIALIISILAIVWVISGLNKSDNSDDNVASIEEPDAQSLSQDDVTEVRVQNLTAQIMNDDVEVTGRTQASRQVVIRAEADGRVATLLLEKGDIVEKGKILAKLAVEDRVARVEEAKQLLKQREIEFNASKELAEKGFNSRVRLAEKEAQLQSARAQLKQTREELSNTVIKAPFNGVINGQMVEIGDYVSKANEMFEIIDLDPIEITGFLTEKQISSLNKGDTAKAMLLNGHLVEGIVSFIASAADRETRTFAIEITVPNTDHFIKEGLTAKIVVPFKEAKAYKISPSILSLSDNGTVGVKIVNSDNIVEFKPVRLLKDTPEYIWVGGLPESIQVITVGQEFVVNGQKVKPVLSEGKDLL